MNKGNDSAFPIIGGHMQGFGASQGDEGLTKRELFAAIAMQGLIAADDYQHVAFIRGEDNNSFAQAAVRLADALLAELSKPKAVVSSPQEMEHELAKEGK